MFKSKKPLSLNRMIPNILTLLALCAGLTAIRYGLKAEFQKACIAVAIAALLDGLDGRVARMLRGTSKFGAELDSLSDFVCFGVVPAMLLYLWALQDVGGLGWAAVLLYCVASASRLARFNTMLDDEAPPPWARNYFTGVPAPAAAGSVLMPMMLSFEIDSTFFHHPVVVGFFLLMVGFLMVSTMPTFSFKKMRVSPKMVLPLMLIVGAFAAFLVTEPWLTLSAVIITYLGSIPLAFRNYRALRARVIADNDDQGASPDAGDDLTPPSTASGKN